MSDKELAVTIFEKTFAAAAEIQFDPAWRNATGYMDNVAKAENIKQFPEGEMFKCRDTFGRRVIIVGTYFGPVVVFDRFSGEDNAIFVYNAPREFDVTDIVSTKGALDLQAMQEMFGHRDHFEPLNIGQKLKKVREGFERVAADRIQKQIDASKARKQSTSDDSGPAE